MIFRVSDQGPGIPDSLRQKVFEPFFTTKGGGTGLGLAIALGVVQGHEGRMRIDPGMPGGTVVTVEVPMRSMRAIRESQAELDDD